MVLGMCAGKLHVQGVPDECRSLLERLGGVRGIATKLSTNVETGINADDIIERVEAYVVVAHARLCVRHTMLRFTRLVGLGMRGKAFPGNPSVSPSVEHWLQCVCCVKWRSGQRVEAG